FVISCADRLPELISASSRSRSSALNFTTYFFAPVLVPATNHPHPRPAGAGTEIQKCHQVSRTRATSSLRGARLAGIPPSRQPLHRGLRIPDHREIGFSPLSPLAPRKTCLFRPFSIPSRRQSVPNATWSTRLRRCERN